MPSSTRTICDLKGCGKNRWKSSNLCLTHTKARNSAYRAKNKPASSDLDASSRNSRAAQDVLIRRPMVGPPTNTEKSCSAFNRDAVVPPPANRNTGDDLTVPEIPQELIERARLERIKRDGIGNNDANPLKLARCAPVRGSWKDREERI